MRVRASLEKLGLLPAPPGTATVVTVEHRRDPNVVAPANHFGEQRVTRRLLGGGRLDLDRDRGRALVTTPFSIGDHDLVHPYLAPIAAVWSSWLGRETFHCSAAMFDGKAWGILGRREAGKSTLVAWLAHRGVPIVTDDLLVVDAPDGQPVAFAGPRSIDLRPAAAELLPDDVELRSVRDGERYRMSLPDIGWQVPLGGWFLLSEADELTVEPVAPAERLHVLAEHRSVHVPIERGVQWMDLAALPTFRVRRPKRWGSTDQVVEAMQGCAGPGDEGSNLSAT